ncbi:MAG: hypothetical protein AAF221_14120 [Pseudomonadota bacterium]
MTIADENNQTDFSELPNLWRERHASHRSFVKLEFNMCFPKLLTAYGSVWSSVVSYQHRIQGIKYTDRNTDYQKALYFCAQFVMGVELTSTAIMEGLYAQSANLLKQELELLVAIDEILRSDRQEGKIPHVSRSRLYSFGKNYGQFNDIAHPAKSDLVKWFTYFEKDDRSGPTAVPIFRKASARFCFSNHCQFLAIQFAQMSDVFKAVFQVEPSAEEVEAVKRCLNILADEKLIGSI